MEIDELFGLPAHPLLVHIPIVVIPLALLAALVASWAPVRRSALVVAAGLALVGAIGVYLAVGAGEKLEDRVRETEQVEEHTEMGEQVELPAIAFAIVAIGAAAAAVVGARRSGPGADAPGVRSSGRPVPSDGSPAGGGGNGGANLTTPGAVATQVRPVATSAEAAHVHPAGAATRWVVPLLALSIVLGGYTTYTVVQAGHSGAKATWHDTRDARPEGSGDADGDDD